MMYLWISGMELSIKEEIKTYGYYSKGWGGAAVPGVPGVPIVSICNN